MPRPSAWTKYYFVWTKKFPKQKSTYLPVKWMENNFLAMKKCCPWLKTHFPSISHANMYFLAWDKICPGQKIFCLGRWTRHKFKTPLFLGALYLWNVFLKISVVMVSGIASMEKMKLIVLQLVLISTNLLVLNLTTNFCLWNV